CLAKFLKPIKDFSDLRIAAAHARRAVVPPAGGEKAAYCRDGGITCQFRGLKDLRRAHGSLRFDDQIVLLREVVWRQLLADAFDPRGRAAHEERHVSTQRQPDSREFVDRQMQLPDL